MTKFFYAILIASLLVAGIPISSHHATALECKDLQIIFARGSGEEKDSGESFQTFKKTLANKLVLSPVSFLFVDLDYPAVSIGLENLGTALGALFSGGESYEFGDSVNAGVAELKREIDTCPNSKFVLAGYSQGAMVL